nr:alpha/beta fold hydrolase [Nocardia lijiangensis]
MAVATSSAAPPPLGPAVEARAVEVRKHGLSEIVRRTAVRRFAPGFAERDPDAYVASLLMLSTMKPEGYAACCEALAAHDARQLLPRIAAPTLILAGEHDQVTPPSLVRKMAALVPDAKMRVIQGAGHLASVEKPLTFNTLIATHLEDYRREQPAPFRPAARPSGPSAGTGS